MIQTSLQTNLFLYASSAFRIDPPNGPHVPGPVLYIQEQGEVVLKVFTMSGGDEPLRRLRDVIDAHLGDRGELRFICDGPPGPEAGRFVEVENAAGQSVNVGQWRERGDGLWELAVVTHPIPKTETA